MTHVRRFVPADMAAVVDMAAAFHAESPVHSPYPFDRAKVEQLVTTASNHPDWLALVAIDGDTLTGMGLFFAMPMFFSDALQGGDLAFYVCPGKRGTMAAVMLMEALEQWRVSKGIAVMELGINTGIAHDRTLSFFMKAGYQPVGISVRK